MTNERINNTFTAYTNILTGERLSKVCGRRNWVIYIKANTKEAIVGGLGQMERRHLLSAFLWQIAKYGITWGNYTYKKDCLEMVKALEESGFKIKWLNS